MERKYGYLEMLKHSTKIQRTKIWPLRIIGNFLGGYASNHLVKSLDLDEDNNLGLRFKYHAKMWKYLNKPYERWGTYYSLDLDAWKKDLNN
jgi:hypothetical protein